MTCLSSATVMSDGSLAGPGAVSLSTTSTYVAESKRLGASTSVREDAHAAERALVREGLRGHLPEA
eukprot:CAMPEP_0179179144 /NCGR_PEP_ID=MMETSP0796-20121207/88650_1 /TAXON_ID=73915 /ORGANISM="Pyrodinium bahamense, Strain pbaha01" /LENGTH=65 /DNA_ID=CAMNT_0020882789 /DNA_START=338 /DNA_END=535 /DNA_ORIENTATION=+